MCFSVIRKKKNGPKAWFYQEDYENEKIADLLNFDFTEYRLRVTLSGNVGKHTSLKICDTSQICS